MDKKEGQQEFLRPSWDEYFMKLAIDVSTRASCKNVRAGVVIVADSARRILGTGYNGAPSGIDSCLKTGCRKENKGLIYETSLNSGECLGVHGEMNALGHVTALLQHDFTLYSTISPCANCAKNLLVYPITRVVYKKEYNPKERESAEHLFAAKGVKLERLDMKPSRTIETTFGLYDVTHDVFTREEKEKVMEVIKLLRENGI